MNAIYIKNSHIDWQIVQPIPIFEIGLLIEIDASIVVNISSSI